MTMQYLYILIGCISTIMLIVLGIVSLRYRRQTHAVIFFSLMTLTLSLWLLSSFFFVLSRKVEVIVFWQYTKFISVVLTPPLFLAFILLYTGHEKWISKSRLFTLFIIPSITIILALTNSYHHWLFGEFRNAIDGVLLYVEHSEFGWYFWIHTAYSYTLVLIAMLLIVQMAARSYHLYRLKAITLIMGLIPGLVATVIDAFELFPYFKHDFSPFGFSLTGAILFYTIYVRQFFSVIPIARDMQIENMSDGMLVLNEAGQIVDINPAAEAVLHVDSKEVVSLPVEKALIEWHGVIDDYRNRGITQFEVPIEEEGETKVCDVRISRIMDRRDRLIGHLVILRDVTQRKRMEEELRISNGKLTAQLNEINKLHSLLQEQVIRDPLTGLYNRRYLNETFQHITDRTTRKKSPLSILMIDIDHFKNINDAYGHTAGDNVLISLSQAFVNNIRGCDMIYRYGGEEFLILMMDTPLETAMRRAEIIRTSVEEAVFEIDRKRVFVTISIGVATYPFDGSNLWEVIDAADAALYDAKANGRNRIMSMVR